MKINIEPKETKLQNFAKRKFKDTNKLKVKGYIMQTVTMGELKWLYVRQNKL